MSLEKNDKTLLEKTRENLVRNYGAENMVVGKSIRNTIKSISARFVDTVMCIRMAISKWQLKKVSEPEYFGEELRQNRTGQYEQSSGSGIDILAKSCGSTALVLTDGH